MSSSHGQQGPAAERIKGPLTGLPAEAKLVGLVALLLVVGVTPASAPWALAAQGAVAVVVAGLALVDWRAVALRLTIDFPLAVLAVTYALAGRAPHTEVVGVALSRPGLEAGLAILAKATIGVVAVSALAASSSITEILDGLRRLRVPRWFVDMISLTARQLQVLRRELDRLRLATAIRTASRSRRAVLVHGARSLGTLFVHSTERADRLQLAAELRGGPSPAPATTAAGVAAVSQPGSTGVGAAAGASPAGRPVPAAESRGGVAPSSQLDFTGVGAAGGVAPVGRRALAVESRGGVARAGRRAPVVESRGGVAPSSQPDFTGVGAAGGAPAGRRPAPVVESRGGVAPSSVRSRSIGVRGAGGAPPAGRPVPVHWLLALAPALVAVVARVALA